MLPGDLVIFSALVEATSHTSLQLRSEPGFRSVGAWPRCGRMHTGEAALVLAHRRVDDADFVLVLCRAGRFGWIERAWLQVPP